MNVHTQFLLEVQEYVTKNPDVAPYVTEFVASGIRAAQELDRQRACDMETVVALLVHKVQDSDKEYIIKLLEKWKNHASLKMDTTIEKIKENFLSSSKRKRNR